MLGILILCVSGCTTTRYIDSSIDLVAPGVEVESIDECQKIGCSYKLLTTLVDCEITSRKQDFRNNVDQAIVEDNLVEKIKTYSMMVLNWF